jgi:nicotinic acid mononucleotide adenylyltransferase
VVFTPFPLGAKAKADRQPMAQREFHDLKSLFGFREALEKLDPEAPPQARVWGSLRARRIAVLSGSFNPPTLAHLELGRRARRLFNLDRVLFAISRVTIDKERVEGLLLEDRLALLSHIATEEGGGLALVNRGLYFEQARAFRGALGKNPSLFFIVGMDKLLQIFDARYYRSRDEALGVLFTEATLLVAPRADLGKDDFERLLAEAENEPYRDRIYYFELPESTRALSSTRARARIASGQWAAEALPESVARFIAETGAYGPEYAVRRRLLEGLYRIREWAEENVDFARLLEAFRAQKKLKDLIQVDNLSDEELMKLITKILQESDPR